FFLGFTPGIMWPSRTPIVLRPAASRTAHARRTALVPLLIPAKRAWDARTGLGARRAAGAGPTARAFSLPGRRAPSTSAARHTPERCGACRARVGAKYRSPGL